MAYSAVWGAVQALKAGLSANKGLQAYRAGGGSIARQTWLRLYAEAQANQVISQAEAGRPMNRRPVAGEISTITSVRASGFMQYVDVYVRDRVTGAVTAMPQAIRTDSLFSRQKIVSDVLSRYAQSAEEDPGAYPQQILGAVYTGTAQFDPGTTE